MQDLDHKHMLVTALFEKAPKDIDTLTDWVKRLVENVNMQILVQPNLVYCDTPGNEGITGTTVIETSHCAFHIWDNGNPPVMQFDLYSCKRFDPNVVIDMFEELGAVCLQYSLIDRNGKHFISSTGTHYFVSIIDLLTKSKQDIFRDARELKAAERSNIQKESVAEYNKLLRAFSFKHKQHKQNIKDDYRATIANIKSRCNQKNLDFDLTVEWCEEAFKIAKEKWPKMTVIGDDQDSFWYANIDRINSAEGYTQSNCRYIPRALNVAKWKWSDKEVEVLKELIKDL